MKVNMTPNPLDVVTIHASQGDTEARQWGFELHNNGEKNDSSSISNQMVFKAYEGGTEQLLPENGSVPVTAPFLGDIRYPQGLLTDQEFTYRESPTESDGLAWIKSIKGNTIVWNQLVPIDWVSTRTFSDGLSVTNNNDGTYTISGTASQSRFPTRNTEIYGIQGHKYLIQVSSSQNKAVISQNGSSVYVYDKVIYTAQNNNAFIIYFNANTYNNEKIIPMIIDLTKMGLDISSPSEFTSLFPLPYYDYNAGTLLSFNGTGIKTVGKNQYNNAIGLRNLYLNQNTGLLGNGGTTYVADLLTNKQYTLSGTRGNRSLIGFSKKQASELGNGDTIENISSVSLPYTFNSSDYHSVVYYSNTEYVATLGTDVQLEFGTEPTSYEPYTSTTTNLPISTYFPTGMKSAGNAYDELTPTKGITRIGAVDLGSLKWTAVSTDTSGIYRMRSNGLQGLVKNASSTSKIANIICPLYDATGSSDNYRRTKGIAIETNGMLFVYDENYNASTSPETFKQAMSGVYLYYELTTSTETSFTTASLVTENAEIPLSNEDGVLIGKCTEQLSENPGFIDAKIKLSNDDGECYSNKIQLHVERSPQ